ncbi:YbgA family protein [Anaerobacillus sp. MEB173]|uniref:YbgA family protein n=1 Tax=Anaerobacillus sp. MEB173 TaxID=3383345 RepID=UPI003F9012C1
MKTFVKPNVVVSKCLEFAACRYNGDVIRDDFITMLQPYVEFVPVCPEVEIGLGTPREVIRIVEMDEKKRLIQPSKGQDVTDSMVEFASAFVDSLEAVDGFILKSRSPSCGIKDVKVYNSIEKGPTIGKSSGLFAEKVQEKYSNAVIEDEGRLKNFRIREHFLIKLFTIAEFKQLKSEQSLKKLIEFHSKNKYLFMGYNQLRLKKLGQIVANHDQKEAEEIFSLYEEQLNKLFTRLPRYTSNINVSQHIMGYFSNDLSAKEKEYFLELIENYKEKRIPLSTIVSLLKSWAIRFENEYLLSQSYFEPYPEKLIQISDSGKGREL